MTAQGQNILITPHTKYDPNKIPFSSSDYSLLYSLPYVFQYKSLLSLSGHLNKVIAGELTLGLVHAHT